MPSSKRKPATATAKRGATSPFAAPKPYVPMDVRKEVATINRGYSMFSKTAQTATTFLKRAGILDNRGRLAKPYR